MESSWIKGNAISRDALARKTGIDRISYSKLQKRRKIC